MESNREGLFTKKQHFRKRQRNMQMIPCIEISSKIFTNSPILFVGMNPSGADIKHYHDNNKKPDEVYIYRGKSSYYEAMHDFANKCLKKGVNDEVPFDGEYSVLDLFGIVQSTQKEIQNDFLKYPSKYAKMFDLFLKYVEMVNPKVIIVANAFVRRVLRDKYLNVNDDKKYGTFYYNLSGNLKYKLEDNHDYGGYTFTINGASFQLYFSSMLSGQRALDIGSRENLIWLVSNFLSNNP